MNSLIVNLNIHDTVLWDFSQKRDQSVTVVSARLFQRMTQLSQFTWLPSLVTRLVWPTLFVMSTSLDQSWTRRRLLRQSLLLKLHQWSSLDVSVISRHQRVYVHSRPSSLSICQRTVVDASTRTGTFTKIVSFNFRLTTQIIIKHDVI